MLIEETHTKPRDTFEFKLIKPKETSSFKPPSIFGPDSKWMIRLTSLEVYNSLFYHNSRK